MVLRQRGTRLVLAGLCLAALSAIAGAPLFAAEAQKSSSLEADRIDQSAGVDVQANESDLVSHGGALYSPFSTALDTAGSKPHANATPKRHNVDEGSPNLVTAAVTAFVATGILVVLVRVLIAS
ncbi:hypothetical protein [Variovorax sp. MHTC-1]|uniref:hypothetical protein n=1 Tax=Variovorax sp. MHTC-1 TaxID=2495593 RepID=UPI000F88CD0E|nr:hypothetical protein [Variovorax sp. MHTC-1]RST47473.1 hypothetical protein EJI01_27910 [Variovorax sp. MHTC-1]